MLSLHSKLTFIIQSDYLRLVAVQISSVKFTSKEVCLGILPWTPSSSAELCFVEGSLLFFGFQQSHCHLTRGVIAYWSLPTKGSCARAKLS